MHGLQEDQHQTKYFLWARSLIFHRSNIPLQAGNLKGIKYDSTEILFIIIDALPGQGPKITLAVTNCPGGNQDEKEIAELAIKSLLSQRD